MLANRTRPPNEKRNEDLLLFSAISSNCQFVSMNVFQHCRDGQGLSQVPQQYIYPRNKGMYLDIFRCSYCFSPTIYSLIKFDRPGSNLTNRLASSVSASSTMDNKRNAKSAGLPWPKAATRSSQGAPLLPDASPAIRDLTSTESMAPPTATSTSSSSHNEHPAAYTATPGLSTAPPPFPSLLTQQPAPVPQHSFTERLVHQVYFQIFTFSDNRQELWVMEIPVNGYARTREPEQYFFALTGDAGFADHTADYWSHRFNIPTRHFHNPFYNWNHDINDTEPRSTQTPQPTVATLAAQLQERLFAPPRTLAGEVFSGTGPTALTKSRPISPWTNSAF